MLIHRENNRRICEYEAVLFYAGRVARGHRHNGSPYSYIIAIIAKFQTASKGRSLQLECKAVDLWIAAVRDPKPNIAFQF
jgi:hypothetical protein